MLVQIAGLVPESIVDGEGIRYAIFMQGCLRRCKGCHNTQTQSLSGGKFMETDVIIAQWEKNPLLNGITLTGGEPILQLAAANELAATAKNMGLSVWCYTGYDFSAVPSHFLKNVDVLVDGAYIEAERDIELLFRGSRNQRIIDVQTTLALNKLTYWRQRL